MQNKGEIQRFQVLTTKNVKIKNIQKYKIYYFISLGEPVMRENSHGSNWTVQMYLIIIF